MGAVQIYVFDTEENLTEEAVEAFRLPLVPQGTVMVSFKLTVGRIAIAGQDMYTNEAIAHLIPKLSTFISPEYSYCCMKYFDFDQLASTSSIATAVNSQTIKQIKINVPPRNLCCAFDFLVKPTFEKIRNNVLESRTLAELRDRLLPKLMSGEIRVKEAEKMVEEVT
jgi:type I restriction enzyme S subunit